MTGRPWTCAIPPRAKPWARCPNVGQAETARAIDAAAEAWPAWRALTALERANLLLRWNELILAAQKDLGRLMTLEQGKPLPEAEGEIGYGASFIRWFAEEARRLYGEIIPAPWRGKRILATREPVGRVRHRHALELPHGHDRAQGRARPGRGLHHGHQARLGHALFPPWPWANWPSAPASRAA